MIFLIRNGVDFNNISLNLKSKNLNIDLKNIKNYTSELKIIFNKKEFLNYCFNKYIENKNSSRILNKIFLVLVKLNLLTFKNEAYFNIFISSARNI